ncbi:MAG: L,D-transpeptidase [Nitrospirae bacterium]|nr:L,D-transpeptidase [Nitrospirota bacterium]
MRKKKLLGFFIILFAVFIVLEGVGYYLEGQGSKSPDIAVKTKKSHLGRLRAENMSLKGSIEGLSPKGIYIVIDTGRNLLFLRNSGKTIREAVISSGSGNILKDPSGKRRWVFDTPRGMYSVKSKVTDPNWIKPDWAFIEEGEGIPKRFKDRVEENVLGDYALGFGNGYFIHGTLYTRLLGRNVTHGCIRVGDEDLRVIFNISSIGTKIFIF